MRILSSFGSAPLAGYTIGSRVLVFALLPCEGLANAAATMVGQNLGARRPDRAAQSVWRASIFSSALLGAVGVALLLGARPLVGVFTDDPAVLPYGVTYLRIVSLGFPFYALGMVVNQSFNGAGDTWTPTVINLLVFWVLQAPLAWALAHPLGMGPAGVFAALGFCFSVFAVAAVALFRRGRWKETRV
jgi:Na+-driven multidrug efflux pump